MKKALIVLISVITLIIIGYTLKIQEYSLYQITADNFINKLEPTEEPIYDSGIDNVIPDHFRLLYFLSDPKSDYLPPSTRNQYKFSKEVTDSSRQMTDIRSPYTNLNYRVWFKLMNDPKDKQIKSWQAINAEIWWHTYDIQLKTIAEKLILNEGFILKKSELKDGHDILIKETDKNFIIVEIFKTYEDPNPPAGLYIRTFSKKKYFRTRNSNLKVKYYKN